MVGSDLIGVSDLGATEVIWLKGLDERGELCIGEDRLCALR